MALVNSQMPLKSEASAAGYGEVALATAKAGDRFQFMRDGYFCMDKDSAPGAPVFNRTVALRDSFNIKKNK